MNNVGERHQVREAGVDDAPQLAELLHAFNVEFDSPTPGVDVLTARLRAHLPGDRLAAFIAGDPAIAFGLVTFRPSVWFAGPTALLDELYVRPELRGHGIGGRLLDAALAHARAQGSGTFEINVDEGDHDTRRFYEARGFRNVDADSGELMFFYYLDL